MQQYPGFEQFTFIPMLTKNDNRNDGNKRGIEKRRQRQRPGSQNSDLIDYLEKFDAISPDNRDFTDIRDFYTRKKIQTVIYGSDGSPQKDYFSHDERNAYFSNIPGHLLKSALVFVDPDNGLEVKNSSDKHILYSEVNALLARMSDDSILMIYQHFPRERHNRYINKRMLELSEKTSALLSWRQVRYARMEFNKVAVVG
jgi:hypothetical protein